MSVQVWPLVCMKWSKLVFREKIEALTPKVRVLRFLEEAIELAQAEGINEREIGLLINQVYEKPPGHTHMELGGVLVTVAGYAATRDYNLEEVFWKEFTRIMDPVVMERVRTRNLNGDKIGIEPWLGTKS